MRKKKQLAAVSLIGFAIACFVFFSLAHNGFTQEQNTVSEISETAMFANQNLHENSGIAVGFSEEDADSSEDDESNDNGLSAEGNDTEEDLPKEDTDSSEDGEFADKGLSAKGDDTDENLPEDNEDSSEDDKSDDNGLSAEGDSLEKNLPEEDEDSSEDDEFDENELGEESDDTEENLPTEDGDSSEDDESDGNEIDEEGDGTDEELPSEDGDSSEDEESDSDELGEESEEGDESDATEDGLLGEDGILLEDGLDLLGIDAMAAGESSSLNGFVTNVTVTDSSGNPITGEYYVGNSYSFNISFSETESPRNQFKYLAGVLTYTIPSALKIMSPVTDMPIYGSSTKRIGTYSIKSDDGGATWVVVVKFDNVQADGNPTTDSSNFIDFYDNANFKLKIDSEFKSGSGDMSIAFGDNYILNVNLVLPSANISMSKTGKYEALGNSGWYYGGYNAATRLAGYACVITAASSNGENVKDLVFNDLAKDQNGVAVPLAKYKNINYRVFNVNGSYASGGYYDWVNVPAASVTQAANGGIEFPFTGVVLAPGQYIAVRYDIDADYLTPTGDMPSHSGTQSSINDTFFSIKNTASAHGNTAISNTRLDASASAQIDYFNSLSKNAYSNQNASYTTLPDGRIMWQLNLNNIKLSGKTITDILGQYPNQKYIGDITIEIRESYGYYSTGSGAFSYTYGGRKTITVPTTSLTDRFSYTFENTYIDSRDNVTSFNPTCAIITYYTQVDFANYIPDGYYGNTLHIGIIPYLTQKTYITNPNDTANSIRKSSQYVEENGKKYIEYTISARIDGNYSNENIVLYDVLSREVAWSTASWAQCLYISQTPENFHLVVKRTDGDKRTLIDHTYPTLPTASSWVALDTNSETLTYANRGSFTAYVYPNTYQWVLAIQTYSNGTPANSWPYKCPTEMVITYRIPFTSTIYPGTPINTGTYYTVKSTLAEVAESWNGTRYADRVCNYAYFYKGPYGSTTKWIDASNYFNHSKPLDKTLTVQANNIAAFSVVVNPERQTYALSGGSSYRVIDTMSSNLSIISDSIKVYSMNASGVWEDKTSLLGKDPLWEVNLSTDPDTHKTVSIFTVPDKIPVKIEYDTIVSGTIGSNTGVSNKIEIEGVGSYGVDSTFLVTNSGASGGGTRRDVTLVKTDQDNLSKFLEGAVFDLYVNMDTGTGVTKVIGGQTFWRISTGTTNDTGRILFNAPAITSNQDKVYAIVEVTPPTDYKINGDGITLFSFFSDAPMYGRTVQWIYNRISVTNEIAPSYLVRPLPNTGGSGVRASPGFLLIILSGTLFWVWNKRRCITRD